MSNDLLSQTRYWNREAAAFQKIYTHRKSGLANLLDRIFRKDMFERFAFTMRHCRPVENRTFLDVGCGAGRYCIELAKMGAAKAVGIDIAENMLDLCREYAGREGVQDRCEFVRTDLLAYAPESAFDVTIGIGLFDYLRDPAPVLKKMRQVTKDKVILSFPRFWTWRAPVRKLRLALRGGEVRFYTRGRVEALMRQSGFPQFSLSVVGKLFCVVGGGAGFPVRGGIGSPDVVR
jgi:SAM-dependent methyltransferase